MRRRQSHYTGIASQLSVVDTATLSASSKALSFNLPPLIDIAEAAGLSIVAQHLQKALSISEKVFLSINSE